MESKKKTIITVETWQRTVLFRRRTKTVRCEHCAAEVEMFSPALAAQISNSDEQTILRQIEIGELHFSKTPAGKLLICGGSLSKISGNKT